MTGENGIGEVGKGIPLGSIGEKEDLILQAAVLALGLGMCMNLEPRDMEGIRKGLNLCSELMNQIDERFGEFWIVREILTPGIERGIELAKQAGMKGGQ